VISAVRHLDEIRALPSVHLLEVPLAVGDVLVKTVDIRTDAGYVILMHDDEEVLRSDYERILELQDTIFEVLPTDAGRGERHAAERADGAPGGADTGVTMPSGLARIGDTMPVVPESSAEEQRPAHPVLGAEGYAPVHDPFLQERAADHGEGPLYFPPPVRTVPGARQAAVVSNVARGVRAVTRSALVGKLTSAMLRVASVLGLEYGLGLLFVVLVPFFADFVV
jgi:hypothetical protein